MTRKIPKWEHPSLEGSDKGEKGMFASPGKLMRFKKHQIK